MASSPADRLLAAQLAKPRPPVDPVALPGMPTANQTSWLLAHKLMSSILHC